MPESYTGAGCDAEQTHDRGNETSVTFVQEEIDCRRYPFSKESDDRYDSDLSSVAVLPSSLVALLFRLAWTRPPSHRMRQHHESQPE